MGYIAMAFALAIERQRTEMPKKNILVVCASGQGSARLLEMRYRREFGDLIDTCSACDVASIGEIDFSNIDYVFTTVPLPRAVPVPVREVTYFLDSSEARHIKQILGGARDAAGFFRELDEELFFTHLSLPTKQAVIDYLCDRVEEKRPVDADFREKIARREAAAATSFGNLVAIAASHRGGVRRDVRLHRPVGHAGCVGRPWHQGPSGLFGLLPAQGRHRPGRFLWKARRPLHERGGHEAGCGQPRLANIFVRV